VEGLRYVIQMLIDLGYEDADIRRMIGGNAATLMGLDDTGAAATAHADLLTA
jgi:adenine deaminase